MASIITTGTLPEQIPMYVIALLPILMLPPQMMAIRLALFVQRIGPYLHIVILLQLPCGVMALTQACCLLPATSTPALRAVSAATGTGGLVLGTILTTRTACTSLVLAPIATTAISTTGTPCGVCAVASFPLRLFSII